LLKGTKGKLKDAIKAFEQRKNLYSLETIRAECLPSEVFLLDPGKNDSECLENQKDLDTSFVFFINS
jgi:hypothetical protein